MLLVNSLFAGYGNVEVLRDINFEVKENEIVSIVGTNGAGKSTLLKCISGAIKTNSGKIIYKDKEIQNLSSNQIVPFGITRVPEGRELFPNLSVVENLELGAQSREAKKQKSDKLVEVLDLFPDLKGRLNQKAGTLSGGQQQMVAVGRGLMADPDFLMLDEPCLGLAPIIVNQILEIIISLKEKGLTILLIEQNVFHSLNISDRGYVIENGEFVLEGDAKELLSDNKLKQAYLGK